MRVTVIIAIFLSIYSCSLFNEPENQGEVSGVVRDKITNHPVANLKIYLININEMPDSNDLEDIKNRFVDSTYTDHDGVYRFKNISNGTYTAAPNIFKPQKDLIVELNGSCSSGILDVNGGKSELSYQIEDNYSSNRRKVKLNIKITNMKSWELYGIIRYQKGWLADIPWLIYDYESFDPQEVVQSMIISTTVDIGYSFGICELGTRHDFIVYSRYSFDKMFSIDLYENEYPVELYWKYDFTTNDLRRVSIEEF